MGLTKLDVICRSLLKAGWKRTMPVMVIAKGTMLDELIIKGTVADIEERVVKAKPGQPALIIAGNTVDWWRPGAQGQCRILYLGTNPDKYKPLGRIVHLPMISIAPIQLAEADVKQLIGQLPSYDMILLTSRYAVHYFFDLLQREGLTAHSLQQCDFAAVGQDTAFVMEQYGVRARFIPAEETGVGMVAALAVNCDLKGKKILFPRSALPNPYIKEELTKQGAAVTELAIYTNTKPEKRELPADPADKILFTSPSTVRNFLQDYGQIPANLKILSKGPKTAEALQAAGYVSEILVFE